MDPSTRELLNRLIAEAASSPLLVLITQRLDSEYTATTASRHTRSSSRALARRYAGNDVVLAANPPIPNEVIRLLADKAEGVPLFIEESTRMVSTTGRGPDPVDPFRH